jgi:hypothetical protein
MPFKSKAQMRWMFAAEERGELPKGTAKRWAEHTKDTSKLPERKGKGKKDNKEKKSSIISHKNSFFESMFQALLRTIKQANHRAENE